MLLFLLVDFLKGEGEEEVGEDWLSRDLRLSSREDCVEVVIFEQLIISFSYELYDISEPSFLSVSFVFVFSLLFFSSFS